MPPMCRLAGLTQAGPQIDTTTPTVSSVVATGTGITGGTGDLNAGHVVTLTVNLSEAVTVYGRHADADAQRRRHRDLCQWFGHDGADLHLHGGGGADRRQPGGDGGQPRHATVTDGAGNAANLTGAVTTLTGLQIDTTTPAVSSVVATGTGITGGTGDLNAGHVVTLTVNLSEAVTVIRRHADADAQRRRHRDLCQRLGHQRVDLHLHGGGGADTPPTWR